MRRDAVGPCVAECRGIIRGGMPRDGTQWNAVGTCAKDCRGVMRGESRGVERSLVSVLLGVHLPDVLARFWLNELPFLRGQSRNAGAASILADCSSSNNLFLGFGPAVASGVFPWNPRWSVRTR